MTRSVILSVVVRWTTPVLLAFAAVLFFRGHNAPGGGFIAGLLVAAAMALQFLAYGRAASRIRAEWFSYVVAVGLAIAVTTAVTPMLLGYAFFTHTFGYVHVPLLGEVELASASLFDLGVLVVVIGNVITILASITEDR